MVENDNFASCTTDCSAKLLSPAGRPVVDFSIERLPFNPERQEKHPECRERRIASLADFLREYDCSRTPPQECLAEFANGWVPPRFRAGGSCGHFLKESKGPESRIFIYDEFMWNNGLHYYRKKGVAMRAMSVIYAAKNDSAAVYKLLMIAEKTAFDAYFPVFTDLLDSFRVKKLGD